jgi:hypothetical protein
MALPMFCCPAPEVTLTVAKCRWPWMRPPRWTPLADHRESWLEGEVVAPFHCEGLAQRGGRALRRFGGAGDRLLGAVGWVEGERSRSTFTTSVWMRSGTPSSICGRGSLVMVIAAVRGSTLMRAHVYVAEVKGPGDDGHHHAEAEGGAAVPFGEIDAAVIDDVGVRARADGDCERADPACHRIGADRYYVRALASLADEWAALVVSDSPPTVSPMPASGVSRGSASARQPSLRYGCERVGDDHRDSRVGRTPSTQSEFVLTLACHADQEIAFSSVDEPSGFGTCDHRVLQKRSPIADSGPQVCLVLYRTTPKNR